MKKRTLTYLFITITVIIVAYFVAQDQIKRLVFAPRDSKQFASQPSSDRQLNPTSSSDGQPADRHIVATNLEIPWEIKFLPDETLLVTERPGRLLRIYPDVTKQIQVSGVEHVGEGGLLGLALDPDFFQNNWIYLYLTADAGQGLINRVERYRYDLENDSLSDATVIIDNIPGAQYHDGGRIAFGPDGLLYITTGDAGQPDLAQDQNSLAGKILRLNLDGSVPANNLLGNEVYSYGHRNPQGLAWDSSGQLWATEHGPSGLQSGFDEVNNIRNGLNYGWPEIKGDESQPEMVQPSLQSGADDTWAPAGATVINDTLVFVGLRGSAVYTADIEETTVVNLQRHLFQEYGRLRVATIGPDGWLYLATSNRDGRGEVGDNDDKIIRIKPELILGN